MPEITISGTQYKATREYKPGQHMLTEGEAKILTRALHQRIANNLLQKQKSGKLTQEDVTAYEREYQIGGPSPVRGRTAQSQWDPVMTRAMAIARNTVKERLREMIATPGSPYYGRKLTDFTSEAITESATNLVKADPDALEFARKQLEEEKAASERSKQHLNFPLPEPEAA